MSQYATSAVIDQFRGLNQSGDGHNLNLRYATEMENVCVEGGTFRPMRDGRHLEQSLPTAIGTLAYLSPRFGTNQGTTFLVAICDGAVYTKTIDGEDDWVCRYPGDNDDPLTVDDCDWVTYEVNERDGEATAEPVDILLFTNATDGMYCLYADDLSVEHVTIQPTGAASEVRFGVLARYNERIWGSGIAGDPDKLMYSKPYDPFDWDETEIPEDGGGEILQPTWDGDSFVALRQYGSALLAVKRNSIWRIYGTNPGEFTMQREYGGGAIVENTLAVHDEYAYMLGEHGMMRYDGTGAYAHYQDVVATLMRDQVNQNAISKACAGMREGIYCLALPINGSTACNAILEYDTTSRTFALRTDVRVDAFLQIGERLFYTTDDSPGIVFEMDDRWGNVKPCKWISGWQDMGVKSSKKNTFTLYLMVDCPVPVELWLGIRTEKKLKQKHIVTKPNKLTRTHLNNQGRMYRLEIESFASVPYTIAGGLQLDMELDPD